MSEPKELTGRDLLWRGAFFSALVVLLCSELVLGQILGQDSLAEDSAVLAERGRWVLAALAAGLAICGWASPAMGKRPALLILSFAVPVFGFEALAGPIIGRDTTIFMRDAELGWRLRPGSRDVWLGAEVSVNSMGMRGAAGLKPDSHRILFLGDSVVFGAFIKADSDTISAQAERHLLIDDQRTQCLNAGVGGWAPWQERIWYEQTAADLRASVVVVNLVLNDATEPLVLEQHGGGEQGFQLGRSREPGLWSGSTWGHAIRSWRRMASGDTKRSAAADAEALGVYELLSSPSLPISRRAWERHMGEVAELVQAIRDQGATPVVVSHPYTVQFEAEGLWWPQDSIAAWCDLNGVLHLDLGRELSARLDDPVSAYHDGVHPNAYGAALAGEAIARLLIAEGLTH